MSDYPVSLAPNGGWDSRIQVIHCGTLVDSFIITTARYVVLLDTLINPETGAELLDIAGSSLTDARQLLVINTHADWDHCWGNQLFDGPKAVHRAPIIGTRLCAERLRTEERETLDAHINEEPSVFDQVILTPPSILFEDHLEIDGGDLTLHLFSTPGHQPDHLSVYIPELQMLFPGDAAEFPMPMPRSGEALPALRDSLRRLVEFEAQMALYCHAPVTAGSELLKQNIAYFDSLEAHCYEALLRGAPVNPMPDQDAAALIDYPFVEAIPSPDGAPYPPSYLNAHAELIRLMLAYVGAQQN